MVPLKGAACRVDIVGTIDREILVYLEQGGPTISKSVTVNGQVETHTVPLYRGVSEAGWYWVESRKPSRARHLDKAMFLDLLEEVSDHEMNSNTTSFAALQEQSGFARQVIAGDDEDVWNDL
jgi:hypothetical protein